MSDLKITYTATTSLQPYKNGARQHSKKQIEKLKKSIVEFGWVNPLIVDQHGMVLCGSGRLAAAIALGVNEVPTVMLSHMSDAQKAAYVLMDNRLAEEATWSKALLRTELQGLIEIGFDVELTGFDTLEIDTLLSFEAGDQPVDDDVHLPDAHPPVCRVGDLWQIGKHRLYVGDARDGAAYEELMAGERAQLVFTDPPYGCAIAGNVSGLGQVKHENFVMGAGETSLGEFGQTLLRPAFKQIARHVVSGAIAFVCTDWRAAPYLVDAAQGVFHELKNLIVWSKTNAGTGTFYRSGHELIYAYKVLPGKHINNFGLGEGGRHRSNVWVYPGANTFRAGRMQDLADHSTVKTTVRSDWSVGITAVYYMGRFYIIDVFRKRVEFGELKRSVRALCQQHHVSRLLIEDAASGAQLIQQLREEPQPDVPLPLAIHPTTDKIARFEASASRIEAGTVVLPRVAPWLGTFITEVTKFPNGRHDDQADALTQMLANPPMQITPVLAGPELVDTFAQDRIACDEAIDPWGAY